VLGELGEKTMVNIHAGRQDAEEVFDLIIAELKDRRHPELHLTPNFLECFAQGIAEGCGFNYELAIVPRS